MAINIFNVKKWFRMLTGKSVLHVEQGVGKSFTPGKITGYYNDMTQKVTTRQGLVDSPELPQVQTEAGEWIRFPVDIFQFGLGCGDLFLQTGEDKYRQKLLQCCDWALEEQQETGAWSNFFYIYPQDPYGAMCQGEGASLLLRGYVSTKNERYLTAAQRAIDFMLRPVDRGGCAQYDGDGPVLLEYTHLPAVMNGWIFALFGLYDMTLASQEPAYTKAWEGSISALKKMLPRFDGGYWSMYDLEGKIASPFYHDLHIGQMEALYAMTGDAVFMEYGDKWRTQQNNSLKKARAFVKKAWQKIRE